MQKLDATPAIMRFLLQSATLALGFSDSRVFGRGQIAANPAMPFVPDDDL